MRKLSKAMADSFARIARQAAAQVSSQGCRFRPGALCTGSGRCVWRKDAVCNTNEKES